MRLRGFGFGAAVAAVILLAGCSLSTPYPDRALFTINVGTPDAGASKPAPSDVTLRVRRIIAVPPFGGTAFVYRTGPNKLQTDYYDAFAAAPADLISAQLVMWLRGTQQFAAVMDSNAGAVHQWALEGRLQELAIDTSDGKQARAVITLQFVLLDDRDPAPRPLLQRVYTEIVPLKGNDAAAAAEGWSAGCRSIFARLSADLAGAK
jgi:ABC-type uncharacterized transport system auxiliary subunit